MRRRWISAAMLTAILIGSSPVWAHEECDDGEETPRAPTGEAVGTCAQSGINLMIGVATKDKAKQDKAVADLVGHGPNFTIPGSLCPP